MKIEQREAELRIVEISNFEDAISKFWKKHYTEWPYKSYFVPPIFAREQKEAVYHIASKNAQLSKEENTKLNRLLAKEKEENAKQYIFSNFISLSEDLRGRITLFVIYDFKLDKTMAWNFNSAMINNTNIIPQSDIRIDFIIFTSLSQIILINFATQGFNAVKNLNKGCILFQERVKLQTTSTDIANVKIHRLLYCTATPSN